MEKKDISSYIKNIRAKLEKNVVIGAVTAASVLGGTSCTVAIKEQPFDFRKVHKQLLFLETWHRNTEYRKKLLN